MLFSFALAAFVGLLALLHQAVSEMVFVFVVISAILATCFGIAELDPLRPKK